MNEGGKSIILVADFNTSLSLVTDRICGYKISKYMGNIINRLKQLKTYEILHLVL